MKAFSTPGLIAAAGSRRLMGGAANQALLTSSTTKTKTRDQSPDLATAAKKDHLDKRKLSQKSIAELDEEMKQAMESLSGDGGEYGLELEGGKPVAMKRSVKENMFRYI